VVPSVLLIRATTSSPVINLMEATSYFSIIIYAVYNVRAKLSTICLLIV
jgi:hypothetical protein